MPAVKTGFSIVTFVSERGALIEVSPAAPGPNTISMHLFDAAGKPLTPQQVTIELSQPAAGVEPIEQQLTAESPGLYRWTNALMPLAGDWAIRLLVLISDSRKSASTRGSPCADAPSWRRITIR
jgi:copper transport protein